MSLKILAPLALLFGVIGGSAAWSGTLSSAQGNCCVPGAVCCDPPQECCLTATDCCAAGETCCDGGACCAADARVK